MMTESLWTPEKKRKTNKQEYNIYFPPDLHILKLKKKYILIKSRAYSIAPDSRESEAFRRQSFKYQFPNPALEAEKRDIDLVIYKLNTNIQHFSTNYRIYLCLFDTMRLV
jgi:hypothetical protein